MLYMLTYFYENYILSSHPRPHPNSVRRAALSHICENLWFNRRRLHSLICFCNSSVVVYCFCLGLWKQSCLMQLYNQGGSIFIAFLHYHGYSSLILSPNLTGANFLRLTAVWELETIWINFCTVTLKTTGLLAL